MASIWLTRPRRQAVAPALWVGDQAPFDAALHSPQRWRLVAFLRHVGCPFAEHTVLRLREWAQQHPEVAVFIVSHGDEASTHAWLSEIGGLGCAQLVVDAQRQLYGRWGMGYSSLWHFAGPRSLLGVVKLPRHTQPQRQWHTLAARRHLFARCRPRGLGAPARLGAGAGLARALAAPLLQVGAVMLGPAR
jgi:hypothetical protein